MLWCNSVDLDWKTLEEAIFSGGQWTPDLKVVLRESIERISQAGCEINLQNLGLFLGDFMPRHTLDRAEEWQERATRRWLTETKPVLVERLADCFLVGQPSSFAAGRVFPLDG
ncbi:hypothetical protein D9M68_673150 [compost metagenome]